MQTLTNGRKGEELVLSINCDTGDLNEYNNSASILLQNAFEIAGQPKDQFVYEGDAAVFDVLVRGGKEPYSYQWQWSSSRDGKWIDVRGANDRTLLIEDAQTTYTGRYVRCVVRDASGETRISGPALLSVAALPITGDTDNPTLLAALMLISLGMAVFLILKSRKRV